jgi:hypothetical protein
MKRRLISLLFVIIIIFAIPSGVFAQNYSFQLDKETVNLFWNKDGTLSIDYVFAFTNDPGASPIDFIDVGIPNNNYSLNSISADVNGQKITDITESPYVTYGVAVGLGSNAIPAGQTGTVHVLIDNVRGVLYPDSTNTNDASAVFSPTYFDKQFVHGSTDMTVTFHLPPGVQPDEPRWHSAPSGFPSTPETSLDSQGNVTYSWHNPNANGYSQYEFGASFPMKYVPDSAIVRAPSPSFFSQINWGALVPLLCFVFFGFFIFIGLYSDRQRKMRYLPPKISIEGHGIKRGLTAVEAAILMEQPMDKVLTMILFSVIKKNAAKVVSRDPLELEKITPQPEGLNPYEVDFLASFEEKKGAPRRKTLQKTMVDLVKSVSQKMKGFSRRETVAYYRSIIDKAWTQVEAADTPEVKSEKFDEVMEWTMLDRHYDDRTRDIFRTGPVFVPVWWPRFDPGYGGAVPRTSGAPVSTSMPSIPSKGGGPSLPTLPGSTFAASVVTSVQNFSSSVIGNVTDFTRGITNVTNPPPKPTSSGKSWGSGGSGCACACACACAGCACACAGGGR